MGPGVGDAAIVRHIMSNFAVSEGKLNAIAIIAHARQNTKARCLLLLEPIQKGSSSNGLGSLPSILSKAKDVPGYEAAHPMLSGRVSAQCYECSGWSDS